MPANPTQATTLDSALAAFRAAQAPAQQFEILDELVLLSYPGPATVRVFNALAALAPAKRHALAFVSQMPEPIPAAVVLLAAQALQDRANPVPLRLSVAGKLLATVQDNPKFVGPVVRSVTNGLSRSRSLERMLQLQSRVEKCETLDTMIQAAEARVKLKCPKCGVKLHRVAFIKHLWKKHRVEYIRGVVVESQIGMERTISEAANQKSPEAVDAAYDRTLHFFPKANTTQVLQAISARQRAAGLPVPAVLMEEAQQARSGLCCGCLTFVPDPVPALPPPLSLGAGRLSGEGYALAVKKTSRGRTMTLTTPDDGPVRIGATTPRFSPRGFGVVFAAWVFLPLFIGVLVLPDKRISSLMMAWIGLAVLVISYFLARTMRRKLPQTDVALVDVAWKEVVPDLIRQKDASKFLLRLCTASVGIGSEDERAKTLKTIESRLLDIAAPEPLEWQLLAAVRVLRTSDGANIGKERLVGLLSTFESFFTAEAPPVYVEALAEILLTTGELPPTDQRRFALLLMGVAYDHGLMPLDLIRLLRFTPWLKMLLGSPTVKELRITYIMWKGKNAEPWTNVGKAVTLMELAQTSPATSRRILAANPDALLKLELPDGAERELGEVILTSRGLIISGQLIADPEATLDVARSPRGSGWYLVLGSQRLNLDRKLSPEVLNQLWAWLRYRVNKILPQAEQLDQTRTDRLAKILKPLVKTCPLCSVRFICHAGKLGESWPLE